MNVSLVAFAFPGCVNRFAGGAGGSAPPHVVITHEVIDQEIKRARMVGFSRRLCVWGLSKMAIDSAARRIQKSAMDGPQPPILRNSGHCSTCDLDVEFIAKNAWLRITTFAKTAEAFRGSGP